METPTYLPITVLFLAAVGLLFLAGTAAMIEKSPPHEALVTAKRTVKDFFVGPWFRDSKIIPWKSIAVDCCEPSIG
jgi:hypothetical protein